MSQILDAINRAEKARRRYVETGQSNTGLDKSTLYQLIVEQQLKQTSQKRQRIVFTGLGLGLVCLAIVYYYQGWFGLSINKDLSTTPTTQPESIVSDNADKTKIPAVMTQTKVTDNTLQRSITNRASLIAEKKQQSQNNMLQQPDNSTIKIKNNTQPLLTLTPVNSGNQGIDTNTLSELKPITTPPTTRPLAAATAHQRKTRHSNNRPKKSPDPKPKSSTTSRKQRSSTKRLSAASRGITITALVYDQQPTSRFILIKGKTVREGEIIPNTTMRIVQILAKGIIVDDGQGEVLIRVH